MPWSINDYKPDPDDNTDINGVNIAEGCPPSGINNAIRQVMADIAASGVAEAPAGIAALETALAEKADQAEVDALAEEVSSLPTGIPEAPQNGKTYGRNNASWAEVTDGGGGGVPEAPTDGKQYARKSAAWSEVVVPQPDGTNLVTDDSGKLNLSTQNQTKIGYVDIGKNVSQAISDAVSGISGGPGTGSFPGTLLAWITTAGSGNFTVPDANGDGKPYTVQINRKGAGGAGGGIGTVYGGGEGEEVISLHTVTPGQVLPYVIGSKGLGKTGQGSGNAGGSTTMLGLTAAGGLGGTESLWAAAQASVGTPTVSSTILRVGGSTTLTGVSNNTGLYQSGCGAGRYGGRGGSFQTNYSSGTAFDAENGRLGCGGGGATSQGAGTGRSGDGGDGYIEIWKV